MANFNADRQVRQTDIVPIDKGPKKCVIKLLIGLPHIFVVFCLSGQCFSIIGSLETTLSHIL